jgi:hypothetical protein
MSCYRFTTFYGVSLLEPKPESHRFDEVKFRPEQRGGGTV